MNILETTIETAVKFAIIMLVLYAMVFVGSTALVFTHDARQAAEFPTEKLPGVLEFLNSEAGEHSMYVQEISQCGTRGGELAYDYNNVQQCTIPYTKADFLLEFYDYTASN